jgi:hypothetical protein
MTTPGLFLVLLVAAAPAGERTVAKLSIAPSKPGAAAVETWVTRGRTDDGGIVVRVVAKGVGPKPQSLTVYNSEEEDDGVLDEDVRALGAKVIDLPGVGKLLRIDITYRWPESGKKVEHTDTTLVGFDGKTHKLLELRTRVQRDQPKRCRQLEETTFAGELVDDAPRLVTTTVQRAQPTLGDDDLPVDKTCVAPTGAQRKIYRFKEGKFVVDEPPPPAPPPEGGSDGGAD